MKSLRCWIRVFVLACLVPFLAQLSSAQSVTVERSPSAVADGGGTGSTGSPYAAFIRIVGGGAAGNQQAYVKWFTGTNNEFMWSSTGVWSNSTAFANTNQPVVTLDASGNYAGWIYAKHNTIVGATMAVRYRIVGTSTQFTSATKTFNVLAMNSGGNGGWVVRTSSPAVNKAVIAYTGSTAVGSYRSEDNSITEGFAYASGGFKMAVPAGVVDSIVSYNDDGTRDQAFTGPWVVVAGQETDASVGGAHVGRGSARLNAATVQGGAAQNFKLTIFGEAPYTITNARIMLPAGWNWSKLPADMTVSGAGSPVLALGGDTIIVSGMALTGTDSTVVGISNVSPPDTTARFSWNVTTGVHPDSLFALSVQPSLLVYGTPIPISAVKANNSAGVPLLNNQTVTVRGIVTVANEFGGPSYMQDNSGGMAVYGFEVSKSVRAGDEILVTGLVQPFTGLTEIVNPILHKIVSSGNAVEPILATVGQIAHDGASGVETYEGRLVRINNVISSGTGTWAKNTNYSLFDGIDTVQVRIDDSTNIVGMPVPASSFDVVGVVGQYVTTSPFIGGYQLMPRSNADIMTAGPVITAFPVESKILPTSLQINWKSAKPGTSELRYGKTPQLELGHAGDTSASVNHAVTLIGLDPATVYYIKAYTAAGDTSFASTLIASTASPAGSSGTINVYFNKSVNTALARPTTALSLQDLPSRVITRINAARRSIDVALYSLSGSPGDNVAVALIAAKQRGVSVRVICEADNKSTNAFTALAANSVPFIDDKFDAVNAGAGLMHNKFFVIDARGGAPESVWVWTGSWNVTLSGSNDDYQNTVEIQDQALAGAYTLEFNEMWGSATTTPNASQSRFGARKTDNTPHRFVIGGRNVESYFSPSDGATARIIAEISAAQHSVAVGTMTITRSDIASALSAQRTGGKKVRIIVDNNTDTGTQYPYLVSQSMDIRLKTGPGIFHHKYMTVDAEDPLWGGTVVTGSHNWSNSAETSNNENTLIIHDGSIANQYVQEFAARYYQFGGGDSIRTRVGEGGVALRYHLEQNYPNPFNPSTEVRFEIKDAGAVRLKVYDVIGREVATLADEVKPAGEYSVKFDGSGLASGVYYVRLQSAGRMSVIKMILMK